MAKALGRALIRASYKVGISFYFTIRQGAGSGIKINLKNASVQVLNGTSELPVQNAIQKTLKSGAVFYDVGSNIGFFALLAARLVGYEGRVYAFEPIEANVELIRKNAAKNGFPNIFLRPVAVGRQNGSATIFVTRHPGGATLEDLPDNEFPPDAIGTKQVKIVAIDDLIKKGELPPPSLVKIDVEGAELEVLMGMENVLRQRRPAVIFETDASSEAKCDSKYRKVAAYLEERGYQLQSLMGSYSSSSRTVRHALALPIEVARKGQSPLPSTADRQGN